MVQMNLWTNAEILKVQDSDLFLNYQGPLMVFNVEPINFNVKMVVAFLGTCNARENLSVMMNQMKNNAVSILYIFLYNVR